ncbi:ABC transporter ATP-binding protein [Pseudobutyrivibrio ruminis]|uniref:ABC-2 type transport system ATP-binding protein n=1 Tax=Pseudobutyrivibrio ruminis DSM 9787 TaxID=1123011 RepID=A0A285RK71_9FIRM|nr:ATP-binding cassette domain-containing protein [Pseudobutyrivibrio ruminis]SOB92717.1 ABC-2 type transport system ATP-binding protein [Pseudobutyrivibrio ruminis DSM 9787]
MIDIENLCKDYVLKSKEPGLKGAMKGLVKPNHKIIHAVKDLSFHIDTGEIVGFIGPNGAGKSTTIKMMSGILTPTQGQVLIDGRNISKHRKEVVKDIGVVFGQRSQLNWDLRLGESFELLKHIYQINQKEYDKTLDELDQILGIKELLDKPVRQMSLGQRVKGDLVASMIHSPKVLFLDEPTIGLDVSAKYALRKFIKEINKVRQTTVILTTHDLGDIQELCERLIVINSGVLMEDGNLSEIVDRIAPYKTLVVEYYDEAAPEHNRCKLIEQDGNVAKYRFMKNDVTAAEIIADLSKEKTIKDVSIEETGIDDIIKIVYGA